LPGRTLFGSDVQGPKECLDRLGFQRKCPGIAPGAGEENPPQVGECAGQTGKSYPDGAGTGGVTVGVVGDAVEGYVSSPLYSRIPCIIQGQRSSLIYRCWTLLFPVQNRLVTAQPSQGGSLSGSSHKPEERSPVPPTGKCTIPRTKSRHVSPGSSQ
jgi:hypothetical protein